MSRKVGGKLEKRSYLSQPPCERRNQNRQFLMASRRKKRISSAASSLTLPLALCDKRVWRVWIDTNAEFGEKILNALTQTVITLSLNTMTN